MTMQLNSEQQYILDSILAFLRDDELDVLILRGSAGTGKTTLIAEAVKKLQEEKISFRLMAPTARAARVLSQKLARAETGLDDVVCNTIHSGIYAAPVTELMGDDEHIEDADISQFFPLKSDEPLWQVAIVDEASMIGDLENKRAAIQFGSGRLLCDLITHARIGGGVQGKSSSRKIIFVGDEVQLPPVGEFSSPALNVDYLNGEYRLAVCEFTLNQVMRQDENSAILDQACRLRDSIKSARLSPLPVPQAGESFAHLSYEAAVEHFVAQRRAKKIVTIITHSNAMALSYNQSIRARLWGRQAASVQCGEWLLINKNSPLHGLSNGDIAKVHALADRVEYVNIRIAKAAPVTLCFRDVTLKYRQASGEIATLNCKILENLLDSSHNGLSHVEQRALLVHFFSRHKGLESGTPAFSRALDADPYYNALSVKYGYAITCHKAQGGEWEEIIIDIPTRFNGRHSNTHFRWVYTAITRASKRLCLVNAGNFFSQRSPSWPDMAWSARDRSLACEPSA